MLIGLCCLVELVLAAADAGMIGTTRWRGLAYQNGAFWAGLLSDWRPNYAAQPYVMFLTHAFLHGGFGHLIGNMLTLAFLGPVVQGRAGMGGFLVIYAISVIGGAAGFAVLSSTPLPMVGASGALFGLAGALLYWDWSDRRRANQHFWPVLRMILLLVVLNVGMWLMLDGYLAWETHLAGFVAGWTAAAMVSCRSRHQSDV
jgi:membrane associated rhomboid family serine protease